jgi:hypothetical protein
VLAVAVLVPYGYTVAQVWGATGDDLRFTRQEQDGVAYLRPLVTLVGVTVDLQSALLRSETPDEGTVRAAIAAVDRADADLGAELGTSRRWADAKAQVEDLLGQGRTGSTSFAAATRAVDLLTALAAAVGDASNLILDPELDSYYLMDAVLLRVPGILVESGRMSDRRFLASRARVPGPAVAVAQENLRVQAAALDTGLRKSLAATDSSTLGPALLAQIDVLQATVNQLAPPSAALGTSSPLPSPALVRAAQARVGDAALDVGATGLDQLEVLLASRASGLEAQRRTILLVTAGGVALGVAVLWFGTGTGRRPDRQDDDDEDAAPAPELPELDLLDARELLGARQLVRVGRAVAPAREPQ